MLPVDPGCKQPGPPRGAEFLAKSRYAALSDPWNYSAVIERAIKPDFDEYANLRNNLPGVAFPAHEPVRYYFTDRRDAYHKLAIEINPASARLMEVGAPGIDTIIDWALLYGSMYGPGEASFLEFFESTPSFKIVVNGQKAQKLEGIVLELRFKEGMDAFAFNRKLGQLR